MNSNWSNGYVADVTYSHGYYHELAPSFLRLALLLHGLGNGGGDPATGSYTYCELGYGQGVSANLHAAANPRGRFWGTDFNPEHALFARSLAQQAGIQADWMAASFEELLEADLPSFDFITLHGVWSWIDSTARHAIVEFMRRRLKVGGVVYISYNIMPGWSAEKPLRDLMRLHTELAGAQGASTVSRIRGALAFAQRLRAGGAAFFEQDPRAGAMLDDMARDDIHVVAHEYFNRSWHLTYFADLARSLEAAGLGFACSIHKSDLAGLTDQRRRACRLDDADISPALRETTHDFILNRRFRRDVFVRGAQRLTCAERESRLRALGILLLRPADLPQGAVPTPYGAVQLDAAVCHKLLEALDPAGAPVPLGDLMARAGLADAPAETVFQVVAALVAHTTLGIAFPDDARHADATCARALNLATAARTQADDVLRYLASPVTGQAVEAGAADRLCLLAWEQGVREADVLAEALRQSGVHEPQAQARRFLQDVVPGWRRLGLLAAEGA
ncbi:MAG: hypothetical protein RIS88_1915 [Pseudomonadota bacterium]|jgi:SAM-dependent methyltransferase